MSDNPNALAIAPSLDNALAKIEEPQLIRLAALAKRSVVVGAGNARRAINDNEAASLALISMATGASFVNGELYLTDTGPMFGVSLYERKADEYMWALLPGTSYHIHYRTAEPGVDAIYNPDKGDVAQVAVLTRDDWDATWQKSFKEYFTLLVGAGAPWSEANTFALQMTGPKPSLEFVGVVDGRESFSGVVYENNQKTSEKKPEMFDRIERARKRARKGVLKHGFPRLNIPEPAEIMAKPQAARLVEVVRKAPSVELPATAQLTIVSDMDGVAQNILDELGYATDQPPTIVTRPADQNPYVSRETLEQEKYPVDPKLAFAEVGSDGVMYGDLPNADLEKKMIGINKKLANKDTPHAERENLQYKRDCIATIKAVRASQV